MNFRQNNSTPFLSRAFRYIALLGFIVCLSFSGYAQNAKGDKPVNNKSKVREARFKSRSKQGDRPRTKDIAGRRVRTKNKSSANRAVIHHQMPKAAKARYKRDGDRAGKPVRPVYGSQPRDVQRADRSRRVAPRSATGQTRNIFPQFGKYNRNPSQKPRTVQRPVSNRAQLARLRKMQSPPPGSKRARQKVQPRSASRAFIMNRSINPIARFKRKSRRGEVAVTRDLAGRKLRAKNYETPRPGVIQPSFNPYFGRKRVGDRPYKGPAAGRHMSATKTKERPWRGDVAGRKVRGRNYRSKVNTGGGTALLGGTPPRPRFGDKQRHTRIKGGGFRSASLPAEKRAGKAPIPVRPPGAGARGMGKFQGNVKMHELKPQMGPQGADYTGNIKARRKKKGGGSVSGRLWNNKGVPVPVRPPSGDTQRAGKFQGNLKARRPEKGGGSVSGKLWNNKETPIPARPPSDATQRAGKFQGNLKARRPEKGGGSVSGKLWNNKGTPIPVRPPSDATQRASKFQGNLKARRPEKGGGSVSGKLWNNKETPIPAKPPTEATQRAARFQGNLKAKRQEKGGGSVSGKLWNNKETPIPVKPPTEATQRASRHAGNELLFDSKPDMRDQGEEFTGYIKLKRFRKNYVKNPNAADEALKAKRPDKTTYKVDDLQIKVKQYQYVKNKSSADEALKVREPGKAFGRATDYQGNIKMKKFELFAKKDLHPDARFVKLNKNNVASEKDAVTNFKLWWARLFKKNETQPEHLKAKEAKPRYDKGEQGLWNE